MALSLKLEGVSYSYPLSGREESPAVTGVSLEVEPGEVLCVAGANGSGKSTLAQLCAGLLQPTGGRVFYGGTQIEGRTALRRLRQSVGIVFQSPEDQLFADTVAKDLAFGPRNRGVRGAELANRVRDAASLVGLPLESLEDRSPFSLSGGEKRRVALAGVLALEPEVLVLDEPFIGLDFEGREHLKAALERYRGLRETSVVIVTHDLADSWGLADRFALLAAGRLERVAVCAELPEREADLSELGMRLPQWGVLAFEAGLLGIEVPDPSDPSALARAIASTMEARDGE